MKKEFLPRGNIGRLIKKRSDLLDKDYNSKEADEIQKRILDSIKNHFKSYQCDFIIETLTMFGQAPNVVYDDNGNFQVSSAGYQQVVTGKQKLFGDMMVLVEKNRWRRTIREALWVYLTKK